MDSHAPVFFNLDPTQTHVTLGPTTLSGYAFDPSGITLITANLAVPGQPSTLISCPENNQDGVWACPVDITALAGSETLQTGDTVTLNLTRTHGVGLVTEPATYTLLVDTTPPTTTTYFERQVITHLLYVPPLLFYQ